MTRLRSLAARVARIETQKQTRAIPIVVRVPWGQTSNEALASFNAKYPERPKGHGIMLVPEKVTDATENSWKAAFKTQQMDLLMSLKSIQRNS